MYANNRLSRRAKERAKLHGRTQHVRHDVPQHSRRRRVAAAQRGGPVGGCVPGACWHADRHHPLSKAGAAVWGG